MSAASCDQNLLFGVLALQADLIDAARFAEACSAWAAQKDIPLADLLVARGWLTPADRADVDKLCRRKLEKHNGDARASLAEVTTGEVRYSLACLADADVQQSVAALFTPGPVASGSTTAHQPQGRGRYTLTRLHAQGGIGQVWLARDPDLGRDVALKELRPERHDHVAAQARFLEEACITGQLEHPGIVPVHELVRPAEGAPFYTMRMVSGRTLAEAIKDYHRQRQAGPAGPLQLRGLLNAFVAVCNAVAYAHSRGVIHRDLKPANVVLGDFGEVVVLDWGLARLLNQRERTEAATRLLPVSLEAGRHEETVQGQVLGTPAYMAPEQAEGRLDLLGPASDVYGLGAVLYELLTGQAPFSGPSDEVLRRVPREEPVRPRLLVSAVPPALEVVCLKALAKQPAARYATAAELAREVERWLADEPVVAYREPWPVRTGRWVRRHRVLAASVAAALVVAVVLGTAGLGYWQQQRQRAGAAAAAAMSEARLRLADGRFTEAMAAAQRGLDLAQTGGAALAVRREAEELVEQIEQEEAAAQRDRRLLAALLEVRGPREGPRYRSDDKGLMVELAELSVDEQFAAAFREWDATFNVDMLRTAEAAARLRARPAAVRAEVVAALDEWASARRQQGLSARKWQRVAELAAAVDDAPTSRQSELRPLLAQGNLGRERALAMLALALRPVPVPFDAGLGPDRQRLRRLVEQTDVSREPVLGLLTLTQALQQAGDDELAERLLGAAVQARPAEVTLQHSLGQVRARLGRWRQAVECFAAARALRPELGVALAGALVSSGRVEQGLAQLQGLVAARPGNPWLRLIHGRALSLLGRDKEAEAAYREAIRLKHDYPAALNHLGAALYALGRHNEAEAACRESIRLKHDDPTAHVHLGNALNDQGRYKEAEAAYREAIRLKHDLLQAHNNLGKALRRQGRHKEAEAACRAAIRIQYDNPSPHFDLGSALSNQGRYKEAEAAFREAIRLKHDFPAAHNNLGNALNPQGRHKEAEAACREAIRLKRDFPEAQVTLGTALYPLGRHKEAEAAYREAIRLKHDYPAAHIGFGNVLYGQGRNKEAEAAYREAIRLKHDDPEAHCNLGQALRNQGRFAEALQSLRRGDALA
jgi:tetratricopeptide (TPR) repeat protein